jgi:hypothetical protein
MGTLGSGLVGLGNVQVAGEPSANGGGGDIAANVWAHREQARLLQIVPGLDFAWVKPNNVLPATIAATPTFDLNNANIMGGGTYPDMSRYITLAGIIYTDLLTQPFAWSVRAMVNPPSNNYTTFGTALNTTGGASAYARLTSYAPYNATNLCIEFFRPGAGGSTVVPTSFVPDGLEHSFALCQDSLGVWRCLVDRVVVKTTINIGNVPAGLMGWSAFSDASLGSTDVAIGEMTYGYLAPTLLSTPLDFSLRPVQVVGFVGDSYTAGSPGVANRWQAPLEGSFTEKFRTANRAPTTYVNLGVGGDTTTDMLARIAAINAANCNHYIILMGLNDFFNHGGAPIPPATSQANYTATMNAIAAAHPAAKITVVSNMWSGSEQRPRGIGPNDNLIDATNAAIVTAVGLQPATRARYINIIPRVYTSYSPVINPSNLDGGVLTQVDKTHPSLTPGQNVLSRCVFDNFTFSV